MQRLLYHAPDNPNQDSPFDRAIVQVVQGQNVSIVSPLHWPAVPPPIDRVVGFMAADFGCAGVAISNTCPGTWRCI